MNRVQNGSKDAVQSTDHPLWPELINQAVQGIQIRTHSKQVGPGEIFVALPGSKANGEHYISEALQCGAGYIVSSNTDVYTGHGGVRFVYHPDPAKALGELARARYQTWKHTYKLLGITGTNGKTTVCYLLEHLLTRAGYRVGVLGTVNYRWPGAEQKARLTTPDCLQTHELLARMQNQGVGLVCMEVSSHALEQNRVAGLKFDLALFSNLSQDHLDYHPSMQDYFQAKARLFTSDSLGQPWAVLNMDDPFGRKLAGMCPSVLGFGLQRQSLDSENFLQGRLQYISKQGLLLEMFYNNRIWQLQSRLPGRHNASNLLAAQAAGLVLGLDPDCFQSLQEFQNIPGRLQRVPNDQGLNVFVDYAHTPDALLNVLWALKEMGFARLLVVFGCGGDRDKQKRPLMGEAVARYADLALLTSDNPRHEDPEQIMQQVLPGLQSCPEVVQEPDRREAISIALQRTTPEDALLIAGKGHEEYQQIGAQQIRFSDLETVLELLGQERINTKR